MSLEAAIGAWQALLGPDRVLSADEAQATWGADTGGSRRRILAGLRPASAMQVAEVVRIAARERTPLYPISTGHNWGYGSALPASDGCAIVDLSGLCRILDFDPVLGVVTLEPGVTQAMLSEFLERGHHSFMVPATGAGPTCSLVGNALERGYGITPYTDHFGAVTDLEAVLPDGSIYQTTLRRLGADTAARLFKWGVGPYTPGLFTQGRFGIVTRMTIALARRPAATVACLFGLREDATLEPAVERIQRMLAEMGACIGGINLMNRHRVLAMSAPYPQGEVGPDGLLPAATVARMGREYQIAPWTGFGTLYGTRRVVAAVQHELRAALRGIAHRLLFMSPARARLLRSTASRLPGAWGQRLGASAATLEKSMDLVLGRPSEVALPLAYWRSPNARTSGPRDPARDGCGVLWYAPLVPMRPQPVRQYVQMVHEVTRPHAMEPLITFTSIGDRLFDSTVPLLFDGSNPAAATRARNCLGALFDAGRPLGLLPYRVGVDEFPRLVPDDADALLLHERLAQAVDPLGILAPGRYDRARAKEPPSGR